MRIAVIGTPRSGNSWVRRVLSQTFGLEEMSFHNPADIPAVLPDQVVMQLHWYNEPGFRAILASHHFKILVLRRHPLDVLVSALHFVRHEPETARWLNGDVRLPPELDKWGPTSAGFLDYATSLGAEHLLSVSYQWQFEPATIQLRYEALVRNPEAEFAALVKSLGSEAGKLDFGIAAGSFAHFKNLPNRHGWQGRSGIWRHLIPPADAFRIYLRHYRVFRTLGYKPPLNILSRRRAARNWERWL